MIVLRMAYCTRRVRRVWCAFQTVDGVVPSWNRRGGRAVKKYRRRHPLKGTDGVVSPE